MRMDAMKYCDIFGDCYHCPLAACPLAEQVEAAEDEKKDRQEEE